MPCFSTFFSDNSFRPAFQMFGYSDRMVPINHHYDRPACVNQVVGKADLSEKALADGTEGSYSVPRTSSSRSICSIKVRMRCSNS
jgi:hypothetical protein